MRAELFATLADWSPANLDRVEEAWRSYDAAAAAAPVRRP
jgi:hypothetical protein